MNIYVILLLYLQHNYNSHFLMSHSYRVTIIHNKLCQLSAAAQVYFNLGISTATRKAYTVGLHKYNTFCREINQPPIPVRKDTLLLFVTYLAQQNLSYATIQVYLSAVRYCHITTSESTTLRTPRLNYVLKGIRKTCSMNHQPREREPITFQIMERLHTVLSKHPGNYKDIMIWAACCLAYFGLLRVSEFTTSSPDYFDSSTDLMLSDVALDNRVSPTTIQIILKQSKNDQFRAGTTICLGNNYPHSLPSGCTGPVPSYTRWHSRTTVSIT